MSTAWKSDELKVCRLAGAERTGPVGKEGPDCNEAAPWAIQVKRRPTPALPIAWLAQATRDALTDNKARLRAGLTTRPWLLVQVVPRRGHRSLHLATLDVAALNTLRVSAQLWSGTPLQPWGLVCERQPKRPYLRSEEIAALTSGTEQPWIIRQTCARWDVATLDYRVLVQLGKHAGLVPA